MNFGNKNIFTGLFLFSLAGVDNLPDPLVDDSAYHHQNTVVHVVFGFAEPSLKAMNFINI